MQRGWGALAVASALILVAAGAACSSDNRGRDAAGAGRGAGTAGEPSVGDPDAPLPEGYPGYLSSTYVDDAKWLCRPGRANDVCSRNLDATAVAADGSTEVVRHEAAADPPIDCFYVYPTASYDTTANSDFTPGAGEEIATAYNQVARLNSTCRVFAPIYRQITVEGLSDTLLGGLEPGARPAVMAYLDVLDAFRQYIANDSNGRGFVLIGHSQGAQLLTRLINDEIDDEPLLRDRMVAAYLIGASVIVPDGQDVGGTFDNVPLCQSADQTGCVVSYAAFRDSAPPPPGAFFGRGGAGGHAACVNPADLANGGPAELHPYFLLDQVPRTLIGGASAQPFADASRGADVTTPWVTYPGLVEATCKTEGFFTWLSLTVNGDPDDPRTDDIGGAFTPPWGMHLVDFNVAMGDIERLVASEARAYMAAKVS
jgi:Protein of unknown function (DUF3089)